MASCKGEHAAVTSSNICRSQSYCLPPHISIGPNGRLRNGNFISPWLNVLAARLPYVWQHIFLVCYASCYERNWFSEIFHGFTRHCFWPCNCTLIKMWWARLITIHTTMLVDKTVQIFEVHRRGTYQVSEPTNGGLEGRCAQLDSTSYVSILLDNVLFCSGEN